MEIQRGRRVVLRRQEVISKEGNYSPLPSTEKKIGYFRRSTYYLLVAGMCSLGGFAYYWGYMNNMAEGACKLIAKSDHKPYNIRGLKRISNTFRFGTTYHLEKLRNSNVLHHVASLLLRSRDSEVTSRAIGTVGLLLRDRMLCDSAVRDEDLLLLIDAFFESSADRATKHAAAIILGNALMSNQDRLMALKGSNEGQEFMSHVAKYVSLPAAS